jgi:ribosomal protein S27E
MTKHKLKHDRYAKARDGSRFLDIYCVACGAHIALYQKDGLGGLVRLYLDRLLEPQSLSILHLQGHTKSTLPDLKCPKCSALIATPMLYEQESRLALRLIRGTFLKKKSDGTFPRE